MPCICPARGRRFLATCAATAVTIASPIEDLPPVEPVKPLTGSDLIACDYCDAKVRGDEYREHMESEQPKRLRRLGEGQFVD